MWLYSRGKVSSLSTPNSILQVYDTVCPAIHSELQEILQNSNVLFRICALLLISIRDKQYKCHFAYVLALLFCCCQFTANSWKFKKRKKLIPCISQVWKNVVFPDITFCKIKNPSLKPIVFILFNWLSSFHERHKFKNTKVEAH